MPNSDRSEKSGNRLPYPVGASFSKLLDWHLDFGTRPDASPDRPGARWSNVEFSKAVGAEETGKTVRNWRAGRNRPDSLGSIELVLFGRNPALADWRFDLRAAFDGRAVEPEVPLPPGIFLGRGVDLKAVRGAILSDAPARTVLVQGPPGIGKTALTKAVAHDAGVVERFGERPRWFVRLETATTAAVLQDAITRAVGADPKGGFRATLALLGQRPGLLVLDNLETPWEPPGERRATEEVLAALARLPGLAVLASFRGHERVAGPAWTLVHPVERLAFPFDAELFGRIAGRSFADDPHLERFLAALDGVPLAIELVAHHAYGSDSLAPLWAEWERIGADLARHPDHEPGRDTSLPHSIELSLRSRRMTGGAHRLFRLLGRSPAGIAAEDRDRLLGPESFTADETLRRIGLAVVRGGRLDLLSPIREHARRHHRPEAPDEAAWSSHYLDLTRRLGERIGTRDGAGALQRLVPEFANISAAMTAVLPHRLDEAVAVLGGFGRLTFLASLPAPILHDVATACRHVGDSKGEADCLAGLGDIALARSDQDAARQAYDRALPLFRRVGDVRGEAVCIVRLGELALTRCDHEVAHGAFEKAIHLFRRVGSVQGEASCGARLGEIALRRYDYGAARQAFEETLPLFCQIGDVLGEANCIKNLGDIALRQCETDSARRSYGEALPLYRQIGAVLGEANCIKGAGDIALLDADYDAAQQAFETALPLFRKLSSAQGEANCIKNLGEAALARADHDAAHRAFDQALPLYRQIGDVLGEANCTQDLGDAALARLDLDAARQAYEDAVRLFRRFGAVLGEANGLARLGAVALARSDLDRARRFYGEALPLYRQLGDAEGEATCLRRMGHSG